MIAVNAPSARLLPAVRTASPSDRVTRSHRRTRIDSPGPAHPLGAESSHLSCDRFRRSCRLGAHDCNGERLSENSERLYESDNGVLGGPHRSAAGGRSGAPETEMAQRRIDFLSLMYKKSSDPGNSPTASRRKSRQRGGSWRDCFATNALVSANGIGRSPSPMSRRADPRQRGPRLSWAHNARPTCALLETGARGRLVRPCGSAGAMPDQGKAGHAQIRTPA
jgi:hypothetical protein